MNGVVKGGPCEGEMNWEFVVDALKTERERDSHEVAHSVLAHSTPTVVSEPVTRL